ncbi:hypothetical protein QJS04_geneDACA002798 [Acorus gramineus]|uniref:PX domain-containing protein n=1 Tax=Acorus gramineus TaxID=55184 RepID=A0AAV9BU64_ACOGR|nr:hypothetical protein QJS04_geneDACA002798 [Acorus gramineus]
MEGSDPSEGSDGGDASTGYSSCEGSEFERYCSANSALGTASVCSSLGNHSDFFDKSLKYAPEAKPDNGNPLLINSSVAFGSDDWDEFERGESGNDFALQAEKVVIDDSYDEMVMEMEEILFDSMEPHGSGISHGGRGHRAHTSHHSRDGSLTASTSAMDDRFSQTRSSLTIDWIEVVGAKQKKGDVSFGERLVGVKEYTVYKIRVWSGKNQWEVERRYREFDTLHRRLKDFFADHGLDLPSPWASVDRESRKIFGNVSPTVISERSTLIQECLQSILHSVFPFGLPSSLVWFLSPPKTLGDHANSKVLVPRSKQMPASVEKSASSIHEGPPTQDVPVLGKTIQLLVDIRPYKSTKQLLETQYYRCAGCHKNLDAGKTLMQEFVHSFGWGKPRLCEYTGQLFCASCHTNDTAVLPAGVLHLWDFSRHPVSQLAKAYLESIYEQPMLCVSAVNPFLFSRVPALQHIMGIRKKIGAMLPYVRCPYRRSIQNGLGSRRYLLENNDFFALKDLVDLSKGAFAGLPIMIENIASTILEHITQQCLVCYDSGIPCSARQACEDPSSLIFPFQEDEVVRCRSCNSVFHELCFGKFGGCPCSKPSSVTARAGPTETVTHGSHNLDSSISKSNSKSTVGFFSDLFTKSVMQDKTWKPKNRKPVILMGSLPSTSIS